MSYASSLKGITVEPKDLQSCQRMKRKDSVIIKVKFKKQKHRVLFDRNNSQTKALISIRFLWQFIPNQKYAS